MLPKPEVTPRRGQSRDGPERDGPFGPGRGTEPGGGVDCGWGAGRVGWCAGAPALSRGGARRSAREARHEVAKGRIRAVAVRQDRSEEHTSELQSRVELVCRLLLERKYTYGRAYGRGCM